ncbi:putative Mannosyltransferase [Phytophthora infestans]|uniref:Putative Mannosyltransferase n=1 Tax=Phytophthora infestans TaxID=4787 RepID=A0A8S9TGI8_PHYIN|nr:putative Mannosyltransferase [Phytophthora infestans]
MPPNGANQKVLSPKNLPLNPPSMWLSWIQQNTPTRRVLLLGTVLYACVMLIWSAYSIQSTVFTSRLDGSSIDDELQVPSSIFQNKDRLIKDLPPGGTRPRRLKCIAWRSTRGCSPNGPRQPEKDQNCTQIISKGESGYCEVEDVSSGENFRVMQKYCNSLIHAVPFRCEDAQKFVYFRVEAENAAQEALKPSFKLPNVIQSQETARDGIVMVIWYRPDEMNNITILEPLRRLARLEDNITFQEITDPRAKRFVAKIHAIYYSSFDRVLFLDSDNVPVRDPSFLFTSPEFVKSGAIFWPDFWHPDSTIFGLNENSLLWELMDMPFVDMFEQESGQLVVDRRSSIGARALLRASSAELFLVAETFVGG